MEQRCRLCCKSQQPCSRDDGLQSPPFQPPFEHRSSAGAGGTLAYVSLDLNDCRFCLSRSQRRELGGSPGPWWSWIWRVQHLWEVVTFFVYRCLEIAARIVLMALFAVRPLPRPPLWSVTLSTMSGRQNSCCDGCQVAVACSQACRRMATTSARRGAAVLYSGCGERCLHR